MDITFHQLAQTRPISLLTISSQATLLQEEHSQGRLAPGTSLEIHAEAAANKLLLSDAATGRAAATVVQFSAQDDPSVLGWAGLGAFHVVECSGAFTTVAAASAHLTTRTTSDRWDDDDGADGADGAFKVLIAAASPDAPRFYPRVNLRECRVEQSVLACAPPGDDSAVGEDDVWQYADHVLELLSESHVPCLYFVITSCFQVRQADGAKGVPYRPQPTPRTTNIAFSFPSGLVLARDGSAASCGMVEGEGRANSLHTLFEESLSWVLVNCLPPKEFFGYLGGELEMGNSEFMEVHKCYCRGCRVPEGKENWASPRKSN